MLYISRRDSTAKNEFFMIGNPPLVITGIAKSGALITDDDFVIIDGYIYSLTGKTKKIFDGLWEMNGKTVEVRTRPLGNNAIKGVLLLHRDGTTFHSWIRTCLGDIYLPLPEIDGVLCGKDAEEFAGWIYLKNEIPDMETKDRCSNLDET